MNQLAYRLILQVSALLVLSQIVTGCINSKLSGSLRNRLVSVKELGARGDGVNDDRRSIQEAILLYDSIYFPRGQYLLETKTEPQSCLYISSNKYLFFDQDATLIVSRELSETYRKPAVIRVCAEEDPIDIVEIKGLNIEGGNKRSSLNMHGLLVEERIGSVDSLILTNVNIRDVGHTGIHTMARNNKFRGITTRNCGMHGIGVIHFHKGIIHNFDLDGFVSIDDKGYSIDFSGPKDKTGKLLPGFEWNGLARNIESYGSTFGIKTAGEWNLTIKNILVDSSENNGFFINSDAPKHTIKLFNGVFRNCANNGMALEAKTNFVGKNIRIDSCNTGLLVKRTIVDIDSLVVLSDYNNKSGVHLNSESCKISNFRITGNNPKDRYPLWVCSETTKLVNGVIERNGSPYGMIIHENAIDVSIDNLIVDSEYGICNIQKTGRTTMRSVNLERVRKTRIIDKGKKVSIIKKTR